MLLWPLPSFATVSGRRNDVAFRFTTLTAERLVGRIPSLPSVIKNTNTGFFMVFVFFIQCLSHRQSAIPMICLRFGSNSLFMGNTYTLIYAIITSSKKGVFLWM